MLASGKKSSARRQHVDEGRAECRAERTPRQFSRSTISKWSTTASFLVLKGVSLAVPNGGIVALLGANGAGKTTTLKAISNLLHSERGEVTKGAIVFDGAEVQALSPNEVVRRGCIQVMQGRYCFGHLSDRGKSAHRRLYPPRRRGRDPRRSREGLRLFSAAARTAAVDGGLYVRRRAADVRDRPRTDVESEDDFARRAVDGIWRRRSSRRFSRS